MYPSIVGNLTHRVANRFLIHYNSAPFSRQPLTLQTGTHHPAPGNTVVHIANFGANNAGDRLLPVAVRDALSDPLDSPAWRVLHAHKTVSPRLLRMINDSAGVVIGGGGLFLRDTNENQLSGWQWMCSLETLEQINVPIYVVAVGYNRFRDQPDFAPIFTEHLETLVRKAAFFGLRNSGSIRAIESYLPAELHDKLKWQPCYTTVLANLYPDVVRTPEITGRWSVALNCAFDREGLRYGSGRERIMSSVARSMKALSSEFPIRYYCHVDTDEEMVKTLEEHGVPFECYRLYQMTPSAIVELYAEQVLTVGMRGHAQMIPLGCRRPIISLASHEKLWYLLDDIGARDWGIDVTEDDLADILTSRVYSILGQPDLMQKRLDAIQDVNWSKTVDNSEAIQQAASARSVGA
jgi:polysaccharide pyruvyl transferase WcaK-like protein